MIGFIIWIIGLILAIKAVLEIMQWKVDGVKKLLVAILVLLTSWIGLIFYYFWGQFTFNVEINRSICIKKENAVLKLRHFLFLLSYVRLPPFHRTDRSSVV